MRDELQIQIFNLKIPFKNSFSHTSATRSVTQTIIVEITDGVLIGYGESCPREYVTGESIQSVYNFFNSIKVDLLLAVNSFTELREFQLQFASRITDNLAAWCAIELAYLDFFGRRDDKTLEELLNIKTDFKPTSYSAVIGDKLFDGFTKDVSNYNQFGFKDYKLKLSGDTEADYKKMKYLKALVPEATIRVDANNLWSKIEDAVAFVKNAPCKLIGIEEPLISKSLEELVILSKLINCKIILDESFRTIEDLKIIRNCKDRFVLNLRISKQGGLLNSLEIANACIAQNIELIIGAQVGETAILTRASIALARCLNLEIRTMEGAFGTLFLIQDITEPSLQFGKKGFLDLAQFIRVKNKGNQLDVNPGTIRKYSDEF